MCAHVCVCVRVCVCVCHALAPLIMFQFGMLSCLLHSALSVLCAFVALFSVYVCVCVSVCVHVCTICACLKKRYTHLYVIS